MKGKERIRPMVAMGHMMSGYWTAFVWTDDPNGDNRDAWWRYDLASRNVLSFTNKDVLFGPDPLKERMDLWREV